MTLTTCQNCNHPEATHGLGTVPSCSRFTERTADRCDRVCGTGDCKGACEQDRKDADAVARALFLSSPCRARRVLAIREELERCRVSNPGCYAARAQLNVRIRELTEELNRFIQASGARNLSDFDRLVRESLAPSPWGGA